MTTTKIKKPLFAVDMMGNITTPTPGPELKTQIPPTTTTPAACGPQATTTTNPKNIPYLSESDISNRVGGERVVFSPTKASDAILKNLTLAMKSDSPSIYRFNDQIFVDDGERVIKDVLYDAGKDITLQISLKETFDRIRTILLRHPVRFDSDPYLLGVKNGVVDLRAGIVRAYTPYDVITDQIDVTYDPKATCSKFLKFLDEVAPREIDRLMLIDWFVIHAIKQMFPYIMFLDGLGRNGKGIYERVLQRFYGSGSFSGIPLEELNSKRNRFAGSNLIGQRGLIVSEAGEDQVRGKRTLPLNFLKNATGDMMIDSDVKNQQNRRKFKPFFKATIDSNDMPKIDDHSKGFEERFCKADLPYQYVDNPDPKNPMERKKDPLLFDKLTTETELSGLLNIIIQRAPEILKTMSIRKRSGREMLAEYDQQSNSVSVFLDKYCTSSANDYNPGDGSKQMFIFAAGDYLDVVYEKYCEWCNRMVCDKVDNRRFGKAVKNFCGGNIEAFKDRDENGIQHRVYPGFKYIGDEISDSSIDFSDPQKKCEKSASAPLFH